MYTYMATLCNDFTLNLVCQCFFHILTAIVQRLTQKRKHNNCFVRVSVVTITECGFILMSSKVYTLYFRNIYLLDRARGQKTSDQCQPLLMFALELCKQTPGDKDRNYNLK